jgi:hypothetical protein
MHVFPVISQKKKKNSVTVDQFSETHMVLVHQKIEYSNTAWFMDLRSSGCAFRQAGALFIATPLTSVWKALNLTAITSEQNSAHISCYRNKTVHEIMVSWAVTEYPCSRFLRKVGTMYQTTVTIILLFLQNLQDQLIPNMTTYYSHAL